MKIFPVILVPALFFILVVSCAQPITDDAETDSIPSEYYVSVADGTSETYMEEDVLSGKSFTNTIDVRLTDKTVALDGGEARSFAGSDVAPLSGITISYSSSDPTVTITSTTDANVIFDLSGAFTGTVTISSASLYELRLSGVAITASTGPAINITSASKAFIVTAAGSSNAISHTGTGDAALYSEGALIFDGSGFLTVSESVKHGIQSKDYIRVADGTLTITDTAKNAIQCVNGFIFDDGTLIISATGTAVGDESKGIKVKGDDANDSGAGKGYIVVNGGSIIISSVGKAMTAGWDIDDDAEDDDTDYDPNPYVTINNGVIVITTTGTPREDSDPNGSLSPEGIEAKSDLTINKGYIKITSTDDSLNAGDSITIRDGYLYCKSTQNDAIDSNGTMTIVGGTIVAIGADAAEGAFDCDNNTFAISGGTFVGIGGNTSTPTADSCSRNSVILKNLGAASGTTIGLKNTAGSCVFAYKLPKTADVILLSSPEIASSVGYSVYTDGTADSDEAFNNLYLPEITYTGGASAGEITTNSRVTTVDFSSGSGGH